MKNSEIIEKKYTAAVQGIQEEWFKSESTKWYDYIVSLPEDLQITYLIVVFYNQIFNGGFHQYFINGYGQFAKETIEALNKIGAVKKSELLREALRLVNAENDFDEIFRIKLLKREIHTLFSDDDLFGFLDKLDFLFYSDKNEDINFLLGEFLISENK